MPSLAQDQALLRLLQLVSPTLPVGAYSYSEGLETLADQGMLPHAAALLHWLQQSLRYGAIRVEGAVMVRAYDAAHQGDVTGVRQWNDWLSAARETEELRLQSWQMGRSLLKLWQDLSEITKMNSHPSLDVASLGEPGEWNFAIVYGGVASQWQIERETALLGYLQTWGTNLISAGVRLVPLGQTEGQAILWQLQPDLLGTRDKILELKDEDLCSCNWGLALASMNHETLYSRLFRS